MFESSSWFYSEAISSQTNKKQLQHGENLEWRTKYNYVVSHRSEKLNGKKYIAYVLKPSSTNIDRQFRIISIAVCMQINKYSMIPPVSHSVQYDTRNVMELILLRTLVRVVYHHFQKILT